MAKKYIAISVLLMVLLSLGFFSCSGDRPVTFSQLISQADKYNGKTVVLEAFYFSGFEISALSEGIGPANSGAWRIVPTGTLIWVNGGIPQEIVDKLYGQTSTLSGYTERIGKLKVTGKFETGKFGHLDSYQYQISITQADLLDWSPPPAANTLDSPALIIPFTVEPHTPILESDKPVLWPTPSPQLIREPPAINFFTQPGVNPLPEDLQISAISGPLDWSLTGGASWLTISSTSGRAAAEKQSVTVSTSIAGLPEGDYGATLTLRREGTDWFQDIPIKLFITASGPGKILVAPVVPGSGTAFENGIVLGPTRVMTDLFDKSGQNPWAGGYHSAGDLCLLVQGEMRNTTNETVTVDFWAEGYDADGKQTAWTLSSGSLMGIAQKDVLPRSAKEYTLVLSWAEKVNSIKLFANIHNRPK